MPTFAVEISAFVDKVVEAKSIDDVEEKIHLNPDIGLELLRSMQIELIKKIS